MTFGQEIFPAAAVENAAWAEACPACRRGHPGKRLTVAATRRHNKHVLPRRGPVPITQAQFGRAHPKVGCKRERVYHERLGQ